MLNKISLAVLGLVASGVVAAGTMGPVCTPDNVTVPCEEKKWDLGIQALYLQPVLDANFGYGRTALVDFKELDLDWDWGFRLEGSYHYSTGKDVTATWIHYNSSSNTTGLVGVVPLGGQQLLFGQPFELHMSNKFDQVNMVLGQHVDVGMKQNLRFYGGLQYADIRLDTSNHFEVPAALAAELRILSIEQYRNTDFNGVGPVAGIDYSYDITEGFSLTANSALSVLYGTARFNDGFIFSNALVATSAFGSEKRVVASLEAKLGANYAHQMADGLLNIEAGYQVMNYFNALEGRGVNPLLPNTPVANSDYGLQGPYFGVKWIGHA